MENLTSIQTKKELFSKTLNEISLLVGQESKELFSLNGDKILPGLGLESTSKNLSIRSKDLEEGIFKIIVFGQFNRGKSTLLNALIKKPVLPTDNLECTAIITVLLNRPEESMVRIVKIDGSSEMVPIDTFMERFKLDGDDRETLNTTGYIDRFEEVQFAELPSESQLCRNGVMLIDAPGLKASSVRERVANEYLNQSHAVVFLLDAIYPLDKDEQKFITTNFQPGQMQNIFFIVNRVNLLNSDQEVEKVKNDIRQRLMPFYLNGNGHFNEDLYNSRVFFVNARKAEESSLSVPFNHEEYEQSGVASFENELSTYLAGDQKASAIFMETKKYIDNVVAEVEHAARRQTSMLLAPLSQLEQEVKLAESQLQLIESKKNEAERIIARTSASIQEKLSGSFLSLISQMRSSWEEDSRNMEFEKIFSVKNAAGAFWQRMLGTKEAFAQRFGPPVREAVGAYLKSKMDAWAKETVPLIVEQDINDMHDQLNEFISHFSLQLDNVKIGVPTVEPKDTDELGKLNASQWIQLLIQTVFLADPGGAVKTIYNKGNWGQFAASLVQQTIAVGVLVGLVGGPIGWIIFGLWEVFQINTGVSKFADRMRAKIGASVFEKLQEEAPSINDSINRNIHNKFLELMQKVTESLQAQVDERRHEFNSILKQKNDHDFQAENEISRINRIRDRVQFLASALN